MGRVYRPHGWQAAFVAGQMGGGPVRMREALRWDGRITRVHMARRSGHWYASSAMDVGAPRPLAVDNSQTAIGIDMGIKTLRDMQ